MGWELSVEGVLKNDEDYEKMVTIARYCQDLGVDIPNEVLEYFDGEPADDTGYKRTVRLPDEALFKKEDVGWWYVDIVLDKLPDNIDAIRVRAEN